MFKFRVGDIVVFRDHDTTSQCFFRQPFEVKKTYWSNWNDEELILLSGGRVESSSVLQCQEEESVLI